MDRENRLRDLILISEGYGQALVDAAFLAHGIVRAPKMLYHLLDEKGKINLITVLKNTRVFTPFVSNWLFFFSNDRGSTLCNRRKGL